jgi:transposase
MGHLTGDWLVPVSRVAAAGGVSWQTAHEGFVAVAADAQIVVTDTKTASSSAAMDIEVPQPEVEVADAEVDGVVDPDGAERPSRSVSGALPQVEVLGIDDHRRGRPLYHWDLTARRWVADADRWQTVFVDSAGGQGCSARWKGGPGWTPSHG